MIPSSELRIGNYVTVRGNHRFREVVGLPRKWAVDLSFTCGATETFTSEKLMPIPLTVDLLLQYGFTWETTKRQHLCWEVENPNGITFSFTPTQIENGEINCYAENYFGSIWDVKIKYLHQLQNLIFALTNQELTKNGLLDGK